MKILWILFFVFVFHSCKDKEIAKSNSHHLFSLARYVEIEPRWNSFENPTSEKGEGGKENKGAKGHAWDFIKAGESKVLMDVQGPGVINRMWFTTNNRTPLMMRSLRIEIFWDSEDKPAISCPFGDFFGNGLGKLAVHESELFSSAQGRSFQCFIPMPFQKRARIVLINDGQHDLDRLFYDINFIKLKKWSDDYLYLHCFWNRDTLNNLAENYTVLPRIKGKGRFLGVNIGFIANRIYKDLWWGEGETKIYIDGDKEFPTLVGTGVEDYLGSAWSLTETFNNRFSGCQIANGDEREWSFFRYHIYDPIYFKDDIRVEIQTLGGSQKNRVVDLLKQNIPLIPVSLHGGHTFMALMDSVPAVDLVNDDLMDGWVNFYRSDDWSSTAYFYLDKPVSELPELANIKIRTYKLK
jgi:hypothetical protein